jgi:mannose-6-phosphate isomerase-like protein (cupin superfamily)
MSKFNEISKKGLSGFFVDASLAPGRLSLHISQIEPGTSSHPPHTHAGVEAFYVLEGSGAVELEGETIAISANQAVAVDSTRLHGLSNTGSVPMKYLVIIAKP